ncbi:CtsR family transcriptional regulator [Clostridium sp. UBA4548]|uniref:CtsR family transcriptional regulator n=1 Tax=Clostridium sp. UBA4548 TaxID=1946361 RepID=UPI0025BD168D|nr:CtsR family transcriptional regulator [Clostridium sp. UBA4548]
MARLSDVIEEFIKELLEQAKEQEIEIQRNELASYFSCAPSQINYVLTTRFTQDKGYYIESRRGGGGCIRIIRVQYKEHTSLAEIIIHKIGDYITSDSSNKIIDSLKDSGILTEREAKIIKVMLNDRTLTSALDNKNKVRADMLKTVILNILK